jgi:alpha-L-fucosidase
MKGVFLMEKRNMRKIKIMMNDLAYFFVPLILVITIFSCMERSHPPRPYGVLPSARQLAWHEMEFTGFLHFTTNTFTDKEWGYGDESPDIFNPTEFDAEQIVNTAKMAGMKGLILTCKHHDGFCLWPSRFTEHSVQSSPWRDGKGDVVREISDACRRHGLKFGVYLSPWDRNHAGYGEKAYVDYYRNQLRELLTNYGPVFEVWWDGANGGDGYYGGARETRIIDRSTYYSWDETAQIVRELQPEAVIFSDAGPDIRWVGNEKGFAGDPCWQTYSPTPREGETKAGPGTAKYLEATNGHRDGKLWLPAEACVSIRPGWFWHEDQDDRVRSPENLIDLYYSSIGRGATLLLNLPPDRRGLIHENDVRSLREFRRILDATFATDYAADAQFAASNLRGDNRQFSTANLIDQDRQTYWATDDSVTAAEIIVNFDQPKTINVVLLREFLPLGQRIDTWALDRWDDEQWIEFASGEAIGSCRLWRGTPVRSKKIRLRVSGPVCPALSEFGIYIEPGVH